MGSVCACLCCDRSKSKANFLDSSSEKIENSEELSIFIENATYSKIEHKLKSTASSFYLSSLFMHPKLTRVLMVYQPEKDLEYKYSVNNDYLVHSYVFTTTDSFVSELQAKCKLGYMLIGGYHYGSKLKLVFYDTGSAVEAKFSARTVKNASLNLLKSIFAEESDKNFAGCIEVLNSALLVFYKHISPTPYKYKYIVAEFPTSEIAEDFEHELSVKIHECTAGQNQNLKFRASVNVQSSLFLVFTK